MAYVTRRDILFNGAFFHITWLCHNHDFLLRSEYAKQTYYDLMVKYKDQYNITIFSYCFMDNHVHFTGSCVLWKNVSSFMRVVNSRFAKMLNIKLKRKGQVIMDRYKSPVINTYEDLFNVMKYIDLNPFRTKKTKHPKNHRWSSYRCYAHGEKDELITHAPSYLALADSASERETVYREIIETVMETEGYGKKNYSKTYFIGDPDWVFNQYRALRDGLKSRFLESTSSPPI